MGETAHARGVEFSRDNEGGGVGTEVEEHLETRNQHCCSYSFREDNLAAYLGDCEADEFPSRAQMVIVAGNDTKHERADKEALNLDPATTKDLDEVDGKEVPRYVARRRDNQVTISVLEERLIFGFAFGKSNGGEKYRLVEIETVKGNIDKEPARCRTDQLFQMSPLAEVDHECLQLHVFSWWRNMCFDD